MKASFSPFIRVNRVRRCRDNQMYVKCYIMWVELLRWTSSCPHMVLFYRVQSELPFSPLFLEIRLLSAEIFDDLCRWRRSMGFLRCIPHCWVHVFKWQCHVMGILMEPTKRLLLVLYLHALDESLCRYKGICGGVHEMAGIFNCILQYWFMDLNCMVVTMV